MIEVLNHIDDLKKIRNLMKTEKWAEEESQKEYPFPGTIPEGVS
jgi:hypothetical protein